MYENIMDFSSLERPKDRLASDEAAFNRHASEILAGRILAVRLNQDCTNVRNAMLTSALPDQEIAANS
jgi:hypothetical protein